MTPVQIIIGRGRSIAGRPPLSAKNWGRFQASIIAWLADAEHGEFYRSIDGLGLDVDDRVEENATILGSVYDEMLEDLKHHLHWTKAQFDQAVILLIVGELEVIA